MSGIAVDGGMLEGWAHVEQSIANILTTPLNVRVMRRDFGSEIESLADAPMTERVIMAMFAATAMALEPYQVDSAWYGEPRFRLQGVKVLEANAEGVFNLRLSGIYFPRGHLGDLSIQEEAVMIVAAGGLLA